MIDIDVIKTILNETVPLMSQVLKLVCSDWNKYIKVDTDRKQIQNFCVRRGYLELLKYMEFRGNLVYSKMINKAIISGNIPMVTWMTDLGLESDNILLYVSISHNSEMFYWAKNFFFKSEKDFNAKITGDIRDKLIQMERIDILKDLEHSSDDLDKICAHSITKNRIKIFEHFFVYKDDEMLRILIKSMCIWVRRDFLEFLHKNGHDPTNFIEVDWLTDEDARDLIDKYKHGSNFFKSRNSLKSCAAIGNLDLFLECFKSVGNVVIDKSGCCYSAIEGGNLEIFKIILESGAIINHRCWIGAVNFERFDFLTYFFEKKVPVNLDILSWSTKSHNLEIVKWLKKNLFLSQNGITEKFLRENSVNNFDVLDSRNFNIFEWCLENLGEIREETIFNLAKRGNLEALKIAIKYQKTIVERYFDGIWEIAAKSGHVHILQWINTINPFICKKIWSDHVKVLVFLESIGIVFTDDTISTQMHNTFDIDILIWIAKRYKFIIKELKPKREEKSCEKHNIIDINRFFEKYLKPCDHVTIKI